MAGLHAEFVSGRTGPLHVTTFQPAGPPAGTLLVAQPFAEEANKTRRMLALLARCLADRGWAVVLPDPFGTGDSAGDFSDADWALWCADFRAIADRIAEREGAPPAVLGVRVGALWAAEALAGWPRPPEVVFWQPVVEGATALAQFLRLRTAGAMLGGNRESGADLRSRLAAGETLEVAGYDLNPDVAEGLAGSRLAPPGPAGRATWFWLGGVGAPPPVARCAEDWRAAGWSVKLAPMPGDAFWATQEIATVPALVGATADCLQPTASAA